MYSKKKITWRQAMMMIAVFVVIFGAASAVYASTFTDVKGHWAEEQLGDWQSQGLISGYHDGSFQPNREVTRAEFITLVNRAFGYTEEAPVVFTDVKTTDWFYREIAKAVWAGYMEGYQDGSMRPNIPISRQEAAVILCRILKTDLSDINAGKEFDDQEKIAGWSKSSVAAVVIGGYMVGYPNHTFRPENNMTRAEAVTVLSRAAGTILREAGASGPQTGTQTITGNVTVSVSGVTLKNTVIQGNLYLTEGIGEGKVILENVTVTGCVIISGGGDGSASGIFFRNCQAADIVIVAPDDHRIRVVASGNTELENVTCRTGAILEKSALIGKGFVNVTVTGDDVVLSISGAVESLIVAAGADHCKVALADTASVTALTLNAAAAVSGGGTIGTANLNVSGSTIEHWPAVVQTGENIIGTIAGITVGSAEEQDGTEAHPYLIYTAGDLDSVRGGVKGHEDWDLSKSYRMMADIDLSGYQTGKGWEPLGTWDTYFTGTFDGNGYVIRNLYINRPEDYSIGLFGATSGAKLEKIGLMNADVTGGGDVGGIAGDAVDDTVINTCSVEGNIKAFQYYAGGIAGYSDGNICNCYAAGNVSAVTYCAGGLIGENDGIIECSYALCDVLGSSYTGGFVGYNFGSIADTNYVLGGSVTSIDGGYTFWHETTFGRIAGQHEGSGSCSGISVAGLAFFTNPINGAGKDFSGMSGENGSDAADPVVFTGWDFADIWVCGDDGLPVFQWQADLDDQVQPLIHGVSAGMTYYEVAPVWNTETGVSYTATLSKDGGGATAFTAGTTIAVNGVYQLIVTATNTDSGSMSRTSMSFTIDRTLPSAPTINGVTEGAVYNAILPRPQYSSYDACEETLSSDGGTTFASYDDDLFAAVGKTAFVYKVTTKTLTYPEISSEVSFTVNGAGTEEKPFLIYTAADLAAMDDGVPYSWGYSGNDGGGITPLRYELQNNIDLSGVTWQSLGDRYPSGSFSFYGIFDGNDYTISHLTLSDMSRGYLGMFSLNEGQILNLNLTDISVAGSYLTGGLVGQNHGLISGCTISGSVSGNNFIGGLVGYNYNSSSAKIIDCASSVTMSVSGNQGGGSLVGSNNSVIENCSATGSVSGGGYLGGLAGRAGSASEIKTSYATGAVSGTVTLGGLLGENYGTVTDCYATGAVSGSGATIGGLVGINVNAIDQCYAAGNAMGTWAVGGLVGSSYSSITDVTASITDCVALGSAASTEGSLLIGPVVGNNMATVSGCLSGLTSSAAQAKATYTALGWDFDTVWTIIEGSGYPTLLQQ